MEKAERWVTVERYKAERYKEAERYKGGTVQGGVTQRKGDGGVTRVTRTRGVTGTVRNGGTVQAHQRLRAARVITVRNRTGFRLRVGYASLAWSGFFAGNNYSKAFLQRLGFS